MFEFLFAAAVCISPPVAGPVVAQYAPVGQYGGHWGVDFAAGYGDTVSSPASGKVTFAGSVAGMKTVTIEPLPGLKISVSYLSQIDVAAGELVERGERIGLAGLAHGTASVHMSTRVNGTYVDPALWLGCRETDISRALRLVTPPQPYPRTRAHRNSWRNLRPDPYRPPPRGRNRPVRRAGPDPVYAGWRSMAKG